MVVVWCVSGHSLTQGFVVSTINIKIQGFVLYKNLEKECVSIILGRQIEDAGGPSNFSFRITRVDLDDDRSSGSKIPCFFLCASFHIIIHLLLYNDGPKFSPTWERGIREMGRGKRSNILTYYGTVIPTLSYVQEQPIFFFYFLLFYWGITDIQTY